MNLTPVSLTKADKLAGSSNSAVSDPQHPGQHQHTFENIITEPKSPENHPVVTLRKLMQMNSQILPSINELDRSPEGGNSKGSNASEAHKSNTVRSDAHASVHSGTHKASPNRLCPPIQLNFENINNSMEEKKTKGFANLAKRFKLLGLGPSPRNGNNLNSAHKEENDNVYFDNGGEEWENIIIKFPLGIISPYSYFRKVWNIVMVVVLMYFCWILPVRLCFIKQEKSMFFTREAYDYDDIWLPFDILCDLLVLLDIIVSSQSAYENHAGILVSERSQITNSYLRRYFFVDLISLFPVNRNIFSVDGIDFYSPDFNFQLYRFWRVIRLIKLIRVVKANHILSKIFSQMTTNLNKLSVIRFVTFMVIFVNLTSCIWNLLSELEDSSSWVDAANYQDSNIPTRYAAAVYFTLTFLLTIGFGDIVPVTLFERIWAIFFMFFGLIIYGYIVSLLTNSFAKINQIKNIQENKRSFYNDWALTFKLPYETLDLIINTVVDVEASKSGHTMHTMNNNADLLKDLSASLRTQINNFVFKDVIGKIEFFHGKPKNFLIKLIPLLSHMNFNAGEHIYKTGDPSLEVFIVVKGRVSTKCSDYKGVERKQIFVEGSLFGEVDILMKRSRPASVTAEIDCELWRIEKKDFIGILEKFPSIYDEVKQLAQVKQAYRAAKAEDEMHRTPMTLLKSDKNFRDISPYGKRTIARVKITDAQKAMWKNKSATMTWGQSPGTGETEAADQMSPELYRNERGSILNDSLFSQARNKLRKKKKTTILPQPKSGLKEILSKKYFKTQKTMPVQSLIPQSSRLHVTDSNSSLKTTESNFFSSPIRKVRPLAAWEINFQAKKKLLEDFKAKNVDIKDTSEIDQVLEGSETLSRVKGNVLKENDVLEQEFDQKIDYLEGMLTALEDFDDILNQMLEEDDKLVEYSK